MSGKVCLDGGSIRVWYRDMSDKLSVIFNFAWIYLLKDKVFTLFVFIEDVFALRSKMKKLLYV